MSDEPAAPAATESLQDAVLRLKRFWASQGCRLLPPCDFAVPFAGLHPDVFFGVLAEEPCRAAFLQPVRRPLDGRFGEHPYRLTRHLQLLVVLQPPPADVQRLYRQSLEAVGLTLPLHDLRFIECSWTTRSLGSFGTGWHALLDGLGVTRLTFLERLADRDLDAPCVEISYGIERLVMTLQGAASAFQLAWSQHDAGDEPRRRRLERELSRYATEVADCDRLRGRLETLDGESERCLAAGLGRSAYELAVRCLEPIDLLEARGELPARDRADWLDRVRERVVAAAVLESTAEPVDAAGSPKAKTKPAKRAKQSRPAGKQKAPRKKKRSAAKRGGKVPAKVPDEEAPDDETRESGADGG